MLLLVPALPGHGADSFPEEPRESGVILLPGRLPWGPSALPTGEILAPCEDQTITVLNEMALVLDQWQASARFSALVTVGPRSSFQLLAVPLVTGRVEVLVWDPRSRVLAPAFTVSHAAEASASAWDASGTLSIGWQDGHVESWSSKGMQLWTTDLHLSIRWLLVDESLGLYVFAPGEVRLLDNRGREIRRWPLEGTPKGILQTMRGDLFCWTEGGLWRKGYDDSGFSLIDRSVSLLGVVSDRQDRLILTEPNQLRRIGNDGARLSVIPLPRKAQIAAVLDDRGRILVGTVGGMEAWAYDGRLLGTLDTNPAASSPLLTDRGLGAWSSSDWKVHVWSGFQWQAYSWPQTGGNSGRSFSAKRPASIAARSVNWTGDADFTYFSQLVASGEESKQRLVLERFEAQAAAGTLLETWPFANLVLLKIGRSGLTDLQMNRGRVANSWPSLRLRAYALLARTATPEDREELLTLLHREFDPAVAAQGALALARSGWDGDGQLMRLLYELQARMSDQVVVADAAIDAARTLWLINGRSADPSLIPLVTAVFQGAFPRTVKQKAQKFFQDLMEAP